MAITLDTDHAWDVYEMVGRRLDDPMSSGTAWIATVVEAATGRLIIQSAPAATEASARVDAEGKYEAWKRKNRAS